MQSAVLPQCTGQTDRQTDRQTNRWLTGMVCDYWPLSLYKQRGLIITIYNMPIHTLDICQVRWQVELNPESLSQTDCCQSSVSWSACNIRHYSRHVYPEIFVLGWWFKRNKKCWYCHSERGIASLLWDRDRRVPSEVLGQISGQEIRGTIQQTSMLFVWKLICFLQPTFTCRQKCRYVVPY